MEKNEFKKYEEQFYNRIDLELTDLKKFFIKNKEHVDKQKFSLKTLEVYVTIICSGMLYKKNPNYIEEIEIDKSYSNLSKILKQYEKSIEKIDFNSSDILSSIKLDVEKIAMNNFLKKRVSNIQKMINYINIDMLFFLEPHSEYDADCEFLEIACLLGGVNIELFEEAFISLGTYLHMTPFFIEVPGVDINRLEDKTVKLRYYEGLLYFLTEIKGRNKQKIRDEIIKIVKSDPIQFNEEYDLDTALDSIDLIDSEIVSHEYMKELYLELKDIYNAEVEKKYTLTKSKEHLETK